MSSQPEVRHDKITAPERLPRFHVEALAMQKAQRKSRKRLVVDLQLGDSHPVGGDREWFFSYRLGLQRGQPGDTSPQTWER
jgi:hypothetical protein